MKISEATAMGGSTGFFYGIVTTEELISAFVLGMVGAMGGLLINLVIRPYIKKLINKDDEI